MRQEISSSVDRSTEQEQEMLIAFRKQAQKILDNPERFKKYGPAINVGIEEEFSLLNNDSPASEELRNRTISGFDFSDVELGAFQIEIRTEPIDITNEQGLIALSESLSERETAISQSANYLGAKILKIGANPFMPPTNVPRTNKDKYRAVPDFHNHKRRLLVTTLQGEKPIDVSDASIIGLMNSIQANVEALDFEDAIDKLNRSLALSPISTALSPNARFIDLADSYISDIRMIAWEISHDTRTIEEFENGRPTRVGLPKSYYQSMQDYFRRISSYPFILFDPDHALQISIGLNWRDARIKFINNSAVVEFRPISTQATTEENMAIIVFFVGRLLWSQINSEPLAPMALVRRNKMTAMLYGLDAELEFYEHGKIHREKVRDAAHREISRSLEGLRQSRVSNLDYAKELLWKLAERAKGISPTENLAKSIVGTSSNSLERRNAIASTLQEMGAII